MQDREKVSLELYINWQVKVSLSPHEVLEKLQSDSFWGQG